jgi:hypothetical protein
LSLATLELAFLGGDDGVDRGTTHAVALDQVFVEKPDATARDRADSELLGARQADFSHNEDVERCVQRSRNLIRHRDAAAG